MAKARKRGGKLTPADVQPLDVVPPPIWKSREELAAWLAGDLQGWLYVAGALAGSERVSCDLEAALLMDLAKLGEAAARYLRKGENTGFDYEPHTHLATIVRTSRKLLEKMNTNETPEIARLLKVAEIAAHASKAVA